MKSIVFAVIVAASALLGFSAQAGSSISGAKDGVAIQGYDPVAYWTKKESRKGNAAHALEWAGTVWFFETAEHREMFRQDPEKYAPQYGGHCSMSIASGSKTRGAGDAWAVVNGKLYLNGSKDVRTRWLPVSSQKIWEADQRWPGIKRQLEAE